MSRDRVLRCRTLKLISSMRLMKRGVLWVFRISLHGRGSRGTISNFFQICRCLYCNYITIHTHNRRKICYHALHACHVRHTYMQTFLSSKCKYGDADNLPALSLKSEWADRWSVEICIVLCRVEGFPFGNVKQNCSFLTKWSHIWLFNIGICYALEFWQV